MCGFSSGGCTLGWWTILTIKKEELVLILKELLAIRQAELNNSNDCIIFEVCTRNKKGCIASLYRSPSQTNDEFDSFLLNFEQVPFGVIARNSLFDLVTHDFNARAGNWHCTKNELFH